MVTTYIEYQLNDGSTVLVVVEAASGGELRHTAQGAESVIKRSEKTFAESIAGIKSSILTMMQEFEDLPTDEAEVTFGLVATGELGNFAVGKVGLEANYEVKLKWKNRE